MPKSLGLILIAMLVLGLGGFGVTNFSGNVRKIGSVGGADMPVDGYARALQNEIRAIEAQVGQPVSFVQAQAMGLPQRVLSQMVVSAALENEAATLGISVGDQQLAEELNNIQAFHGPDGKLDRVAYAAALDNIGLTEREFEEQLRGESAATLLQGAVLAGTRLPDTYIDTLIDYAAERRAFTWAELGAEALTTGLPVPTDAELTTWYEANIDRFTLPETKQITYAWLTPDMIVDTVEVDEQSLRDAYAEREAEFNMPERRLVERLVFGDQAQAQAAADRLAAGETTFEALVEERGLTLSDTDMGDVTRADLDGAADAVFAAEVGDIAGPAPTGLGPALFRLNAVLPAQETTFEEAQPVLRDALALDRARRVIDGMAQSLDDELAAGATLEELAQDSDLQLGQIGWSAETAEGIASYEAFREAAQALTADDYPQIGQLGDGGIFAMRLEEIRDPAPQPFEDVRDAVEQGWEQQARTDALLEQAQSLAEQMRGGASFEDLGLTARAETGLSRNAQPSDLPAGLVAQAFTLEPGAIASLPGAGSAFVLRLDQVIAPDRSSDEVQTLRQIFGDQAAADIAQDLFQALSSDIQQRAGVVIDQQVINAVHANFQ
ncbi:peptidyl-prolyl cis-trans isomerase [Tropicibacter oceani]|uniref:Parvulin-like PPIase n=1 Tax=Tropicibacter oceani TaxID=3058420 RepID=A0ABY8QFZ5_9RHOB|nr:peptidyl-prolyl cis-trans isomerase [Tropicibacter oceani]WGW02931.1 peptidyl-prolyl cis-trans isomerase [Tropicibacter oceani]